MQQGFHFATSAAMARAMHTVVYRAEREGHDLMPLRRRSGVQDHFGIQRYSTITDTWFADTPRAEEPKAAFLLVAQGP
jgi:hypothetical protein